MLQPKAVSQIYKARVAIGENIARMGQDRKLGGKRCLRMARKCVAFYLKGKTNMGGGGGGSRPLTSI